MIRGFISANVDALTALGFTLDDCWLDPSGPVDATLKLPQFTCVWNEQDGWSAGEFVSGRQGERTVLANARLLGGGVVLDPARFAVLLRDGATAEPTKPRPIRARDGMNDSLQAWN